METHRIIEKRTGNSFCSFKNILTAFLLVSVVKATGELLQLDCIERDWYTVFAKQGYDVTSVELAVTDVASTDMTRLLVAISDENSEDERNSYLAYLDYLTCETLFFTRNDNTYQAGLFSVAIYSDDMSSVKQYETIYEVGKAQDASEIIVTIVEKETVRTIAFDFDSLDYTNDSTDSSFSSKSSLTVVEPNVLIWTHPLGQMVFDLNLMVARSVHYSSDLELTSLTSIITSYRYVSALSWEWSTTGNDVIWINKYDFSRLMGTTFIPILIQSKKFDLGENVDGVVVSDSYDNSVALCYSDSQSNLVLGLWQADNSDSDSLYLATLIGNLAQKVNGCANVELTVTPDLQKIQALVHTSDDYFGLLSYELSQSSKNIMDSSDDSLSLRIALKLSSQKFFIFTKPSNLQFSAAPGFISMNTQLFGEQRKWAFMLNTDLNDIRRTQLWNQSNYQQATLTVISASSAEVQDAYDIVISRSLTSQRLESVLSRWAFMFNAWINELCQQSKRVTKSSDETYELTYPLMQEFQLYFSDIIDTKLDRDANSWFRTCFPNVALEVPTGSSAQFNILDFDETSALIQVENVPSADIYATRYTLLGQNNLRYFERIIYRMQLSTSLGSQYMVAYENDAPRIVNPEPFNNQIFISIQWAPNPLVNKTALFEDFDGKNRDILYESGQISDHEGDLVQLEVLNLTRIFNFELTTDKRIKISMALKMKPEFTGMHDLYFQLTGNEKVEGPPTVYRVTIVIGLYKADPVEYKKRVIKFKALVDEPETLPEEYNIVPGPIEILDTDQWWYRRSYSERKSQLRVAPFSSDGFLKVSFTKSMTFPENIIDLIEEQKLVNVTFVPSTYDVENDEEDQTEIKEWFIKVMSDSGMLIKVVFKNPNMLSHSIYDNDVVNLHVNLTTVLNDGSTDELYGIYVKSVPLQYPEQFQASHIYELNQAIELTPYIIGMLFFFSFSLLVVSSSSDKTAIVWLIVGNLPLLVFLPLINVPVPAQVNEISKGLAKYLRFDFIEFEEHGQSLATTVAQFIFDFPAESNQIPLHLEQMGFNSRNSLQTASGVNLLHCAIVAPVLLLLLIFGLCKTKSKKCGSAFTKLRSVFMCNFYVRYNIETVLVYSICYLMAVSETTFYNWMTSLQSTLSGIHLLMLVMLPLTIIFFYNWNYERLVSNKIFRQMWGSLYLGLVGNEEKSKKTIAYKYPALQLSRKLIFAFFVVILHENWVLQLCVVFLSTTLIIYITSLYSPYQSRILHRMQVMYDFTFFILGDFMITFNGGGWLSSDQNVRFEIGWAYTGVFLSCVSISFLLLAIVTFKAVKRTMMIQVAKKSKQQQKLDKRKNRMQRRQSIRMNALMSQKTINNIIPVMSIDDLGSGSTPNSSSLNSPIESNRVIQQQNENFLQVKIDQKDFKRGLTQIEESSNEEEDETSSLSGTESDLSQTDQDDNFLKQQPNSFVMGFEFLPKISRQKLVFVKSKNSKKRSRSGPRLSQDFNNFNTIPVIQGFIRSGNRKANNTPPNETQLFSPVEKKKSQKRVHRTLMSQSAQSSEDDGSFKASSRIKKGSRTGSKHRRNRSGYSTTKFEDTGANFTQQIHYKIRKQESTSQIDQLSVSQQNTERQHLMSQQDTRRGGILVVPSQISTRSRKLNHQIHPAMSRRSSSVMIDELDDVVSHKLEKIADQMTQKMVRKKSTMISTPQTDFDVSVDDEGQQRMMTPSKRRNAYVMGEQMAKDSMILDMTGNMMIMSKVHESTSDLTPTKYPGRQQSQELQYNNDREFDARRMKRQIQKDSRQSLKVRSKNRSLGGHRLLQQAFTMMEPSEAREIFSGHAQSPPKVTEQRNSLHPSTNNIVSDDSRNSAFIIATTMMDDSSPNIRDPEPSIGSGIVQIQPFKTFKEDEDDVSPQLTRKKSPPPKISDRSKKENSIKNLAEYHYPGPPSIQNLIIPDMPGQSRINLTQVNIPLKIHKRVSLDEDSDEESANSNKSLREIVDIENQKYEKQLEIQRLRNAERLMVVQEASSPGIEETPQFQTNPLSPNFNTTKSGLIRSARKQMQDQHMQRESSKFSMQDNVPMEAKLVQKRGFSFKQKSKESGEGGLEVLDVDQTELSLRRLSSQSKKQSRPADVPYINLNNDNLLQGVNQRVAKTFLKKNISINSIESDLSKVSKFTIEDANNNTNTIGETIKTINDEDLRSSPTNVRFTSMQSTQLQK